MPTYPFFCGKDCGGDACALLATVAGGRVTRIAQNPAGGVYLQGCRRGFDQPIFQDAPGRVLKPLIRVGRRGEGRFREATWEEALDLAAERLGAIRERYGPRAVYAQYAAGDTGALHASYRLLPRFLNLFGGASGASGSYSAGAADFALPYLFGRDYNQSGFDAATMEQAELIVLWGANLLETRLGGQMPMRLSQAKRAGKQIVAIDPRRSATVKSAASWWLPVRPGADAALMLAVLHVLFTEDLADRAAIESLSYGFEALERYVLGAGGGPACTPRCAEAITGLPAAEITRFARAYAAARPAMLIPGYSIQRVYAGEDPMRLAVALQIAQGSFGKVGGSTGSLNSRIPGARIQTLPVPPAPLPPHARVPLPLWPDFILEGTAGGYPADIHAIYALGSNNINQGADIHKSRAAYEKVDFAICHEIFLTPTAQYCDVVLPTATAFEKEDIGIPWLGPHLLYRPQILPPAGEARSDYDILAELAERLGFGEQFSEGRSAAQWIEHFIANSEISDPAEFRRTGVYQPPERMRSGLADFARDPLAHPLDTPSGRVEIASARYAADTGLPAIPTWMPAPLEEGYPLRLITPKSPHRTHSQGQLLELVKRADHALEMHPADAAARAIPDGAVVRVYTARGETRVKVRLTEDLVPGVVCLPEGMWAEIGPDGIDRGGSANMLTATAGTPASGAAIMHGVAVEVART